jgi:fido (protein-threonine AMPylation protein)
MMNGFEEYIKQQEPDKTEKNYVWQTAVGLQEVDGLKPSPYLIETAKQNIEGDITIEEVKQRIDNYYKAKSVSDANDRTEEADKVSVRIAEILSEKTFAFSPAEYITIHKRLFEEIYSFAGRIRDYNISKAEWVLNGETVYYASADSIRATLNYDFEKEKEFKYHGLSLLQIVQHIVSFTSNLWQIYAFGEGNTRTTAVFIIKYLRTFGFDVANTLFAQHSWYFRNALVRANYNDFKKNIHATNEYLERFFRNLLLNENNILKNRELLTFIDNKSNNRSAKKQDNEVSKRKICALKLHSPQDNCTLEEHFVLEFLETNPRATQKEIATHIQKSERTVKTITVNLQQKNLLERRNGKRNGYWVVKLNISVKEKDF